MKTYETTHPTKRQMDIFRFIREELKLNGVPPTMNEIAGAFNIGTRNGVRNQLLAMERRGLMDLLPYTTRGIRVNRACRVCGCTENQPCEGGCAWASNEYNLCDKCVTQ